MKEIRYIITDELGIHARPAGRLVREATGFKCDIRVGGAEKMAGAKNIMGVMGLSMKQGDELIMTFDGEDEEAAAVALEAFLKENL